jgi:hypothetical protein
MRPRILFIVRLLLLTLSAGVILSPLQNADARRLKKKYIREMSGTYPVFFRGAVNDGNSTYSVNRSGYVFIGSGNYGVQSLSGRSFGIKFRRPTGTNRKATFRGSYYGGFINPISGEAERATGIRIAHVTRKGRGKKSQFKIRYRDFLTEGSLSYWRFYGRGKKR